MNFAEKAETVSPEFLEAIKENNEEKLNGFLQEFDTNTLMGIKICNHCIFDLLDKESEKDKPFVEAIMHVRQWLRIQRKLGLRARYTESNDPLVLSSLKDKICNHVSGMLSSIFITNGWVYSLCEAFKNGDVDSSKSPMSDVMRTVMKLKHRNNFLRTMIIQYRSEIKEALSVADINAITAKLIDTYATEHPYDLEAMRFMKRAGNDFDTEE